MVETIEGNLLKIYKLIVPGTMLHVDQLMNERRTHPDEQLRQELRNQWFYTADGEIYFLNGGIPTLAMTREVHNPVLQNIDDAFEQLTKKGNYRPSQEDIQTALAARETVLIALPNLRLSGDGARWRYVTIGTTPAKYDELNDEERKLAERVYGQGNDFAQNMEMLNDAKIGETNIYVLNPDYIRKQAETGAIARASSLNNFNYNSDFNALDRVINIRNRARGVRKGNHGPYRTAMK